MGRAGKGSGGQGWGGRLLKELPSLLTFLKVRQLCILSRGREVPLGQPGLAEPSLLLHLILGLGHGWLQPVLHIQASPLQQGQPGSPLHLAHLGPSDVLPYFLQPLFYAWSLSLWSLLPPLLQPLQHPMSMMLDLIVSGSSARPALNFFLQATLPCHTSCTPFQLQDTHLIIPCWLKLLRWGGGKHSRFLKKKLQILLPAYLGGRLPSVASMLQGYLCSFQLRAAQ